MLQPYIVNGTSRSFKKAGSGGRFQEGDDDKKEEFNKGKKESSIHQTDYITNTPSNYLRLWSDNKVFSGFPFPFPLSLSHHSPPKSYFQAWEFKRIPKVGLDVFKSIWDVGLCMFVCVCVKEKMCLLGSLIFQNFLNWRWCLYVWGRPDCMGKSPCHCVVGFFVSGPVGESLFSSYTLRQVNAGCEIWNTQN